LLHCLDVYWSDKAVSATGHSRYVVGCFRIVVERLTHLTDSDPKTIVKLYEGVFRPQTLPDFLPGDGFACALYQHEQQPVREVLNFYASAVAFEAALFRVQLEGTEAIASYFWRRLHHYPRIQLSSLIASRSL
jgi:hypothetical protein